MEEYLKEISEKYNGTITTEPLKKTYTEVGEFVNGKLQTTVTIKKLTIAFAIDYSDLSKPFTAAILLPGIVPNKCNFIPKNSFLRRLFNKPESLRSNYQIKVDEDFLHEIRSNSELSKHLTENKTHIVIRKKDNQRLLVIHPWFSILSKEDYSKLEKIVLGIVDCISSPKFENY